MGMDAHFFKVPKSKWNLDTNSNKGYGVRVSPYEETYIETDYYNIRNNHVLHDLIEEVIVKGQYHEAEYDNGADYRVTMEMLDELDKRSDYNYEVTEYTRDVKADMIKSKYHGEDIYDYYYTSNW